MIDDTRERLPGFDPGTANPARMYDYWLGGKDNFAADREAAGQIREVFPQAPKLARANRGFVGRAVRYCAEGGIEQFLDVGTGFPTSPTVVEMARELQPRARVAGVDNDPVVLAHDRAHLENDAGVRIVDADLRRPASILASPELAEFFDWDRPVAVLLAAVLHFLPESDDPRGVVAAFRDALPPGSAIVASTLTATGSDPAVAAAIEAVYDHAATPVTFRPAAHIRSWFDGLHLVPPGLVDVTRWPAPDGTPTAVHLLAGAARTPGPRP